MTKDGLSRSLCFFATILFCSRVFSRDLSQPEVYRRCYSQITRLALTKENLAFKEVLAGRLSATKACTQLIEQASLISGLNGIEFPTASEKNKITEIEIKAVVKTFQTFHANWFASYEIVRFEKERGTSIIYDINDTSYYLTRALFLPGARFSSVLEDPDSYIAIRSSGPSSYLMDTDQLGTYFPVSRFGSWILGDVKTATFTPRLIETGTLLGFRKRVAGEKINFLDGGREALQTEPGSPVGAGGILGQTSYLLINSSLPLGARPNGLMFSHRNWSRAVFQDLLCRQIPVLRKSDVTRFVQPEAKAPFRKSENCMQCHSSMDPMAATMRNVFMVAPYSVDEANSTKVAYVYPVTHPKGELNPQINDNDYYVRPPTGEFRMRSFDGTLVEKEVSGTGELGAAIAGTDDLYVCAAKRYFEFFTGIDVEIADFSETEKPSPKLSKYRDLVIDLGKKLKANQSLPKLVENIISSKIYQSSDYGVSR